MPRQQLKSDEAAATDSPSPCWCGENHIPEGGKVSDPSKETITAGLGKRETGQGQQRNSKREVERNAYVQSLARRAEDLSNELSTVVELLRQQHAVCEPREPRGAGFSESPREGTLGAPNQTPEWYRDKTSRTWRLLLSAVREFLEAATEDALQPTPVWLHTPRRRYTDWASHIQLESSRLMDTMERRRWSDVSEHGTTTKRYNLSGADKQN